jgi:hypothetical protein
LTPEPARIAVADEDLLYRRIFAQFVRSDGRLSSAAFKVNSRPDHEISVDLAKLTTPEASVDRAGRPGFLLGQLVAGEARNLGFAIRHDPVAGNPAHALITGENSNSLCRALAGLVTIVPGVRSQDSTS